MGKLTLDEAIKHCEEVAEQNETKALRIGRQYKGTLLNRDAKECRECAADHRQLAEWLSELKDLRDENKVLMHECDRLIKEKGKLLSKVSGGDVLRICQLEEKLEKAKRLLKAAVEDIVWLNEHTVDGEGQCLIETATDMETCLACPLNVNNPHICGWKHQAEVLALIGEDGDTNG